ncbi:hypothetical protein KY289_008221 [Solanum tuberosum]|nr:hypothetical protein KY289_008221 [Solanum tuberosum]
MLYQQQRKFSKIPTQGSILRTSRNISLKEDSRPEHNQVQMVNGLQGSINHNEEQMGTHKHSNHLAPSGSSNSSSNFSFKIKAQDQSNIQIRNDMEPVHNPFNNSNRNDHITHMEAAIVTTQRLHRSHQHRK